ncbi:prepilin-type N-terminal cleavage/methylation domain-containing protein [Patescibacteria group bacterium]|nr:prepilin-type N-terminal cleavage/methylation domain-containing protein [Patescibacteria group bacterium]MBU1015703.1 prepilin-type N-terminal cleavage/methylation domain-containing protein [Patescibacteria group bacterium]MBU1685213.1 prepilin-type N-terminal cleavage/methylation domain-containing protein [Patescibacteria group bacterium]MBU1939056.1 prepilin-type N-terminal cleavage/methylation domain-containing protein [Patescibacteria group bacterium]
MKNKDLKGFTLIELLIVIGIIAILAGIVLVAVNPAQQFGKANDAERKSELGMVLSAVYQFQTSQTAKGKLPECTLNSIVTAIPECDTDLSGVGMGNGGFEGALELGTAATSYDCSTTLVPAYLREIPKDPDSVFDATATGYWICQDSSGLSPRIYIISEAAEVFLEDGGCEVPGTTNATLCISG